MNQSEFDQSLFEDNRYFLKVETMDSNRPLVDKES